MHNGKLLLEALALTKRFGGLTAVDKVSLALSPGEVVGLVGDNGAGKSTLIKIISGVYPPDEGELRLDGKPVRFTSPLEARAHGIETIYQDLALCENLDPPSNIFLGREPVRRLARVLSIVNRPYMDAEARQLLDRLEIRIADLRQPIRALSGGQRQAVAIARAVYWNARLVIMDEPTAALSVPEQRKVLALARALRDQGVSVIFISHNLQDVFEVADRIVVMRRGKKVAELQTTQTSRDEVVSLMVGNDPDGNEKSLPD